MLTVTDPTLACFSFYVTVIGGSWFDHVLGYWEHRNDDNVLFLKYEDLHKVMSHIKG